MGRDYRDGRRRHSRDSARFADGARPPPAALLDHLVRKARQSRIVEALRDPPSLDRAQLLEPLLLAPDVSLVADTVFEDALFLASQSGEEIRRERFESEDIEVLAL